MNGAKLVGATIGFCALMVAGLAEAEPARISAAISGGAGVSLGRGLDGAVLRGTPAFLEASLYVQRAEDVKVQWGSSLLLPVQGTVAFGIAPAVRVFGPKLSIVTPYVGGRLVAYLFPFTLFGGGASLGAAIAIRDPLRICVEMRATAYLFGSDLPDRSVVTSFDAALGLEISL